MCVVFFSLTAAIWISCGRGGPKRTREYTGRTLGSPGFSMVSSRFHPTWGSDGPLQVLCPKQAFQGVAAGSGCCAAASGFQKHIEFKEFLFGQSQQAFFLDQ